MQNSIARINEALANDAPINISVQCLAERGFKPVKNHPEYYEANGGYYHYCPSTERLMFVAGNLPSFRDYLKS